MNKVLFSMIKDNKIALEMYLNSQAEYSEKILTCAPLLSRSQSIVFSLKCLESVAHIYSEYYPSDASIKNCIKYLKTIEDFDDLTEEQEDDLRFHSNKVYNSHLNCENEYACNVAFATYILTDVISGIDNGFTSVAYWSTQSVDYKEKARQQDLNIQFLKQILLA